MINSLPKKLIGFNSTMDCNSPPTYDEAINGFYIEPYEAPPSYEFLFDQRNKRNFNGLNFFKKLCRGKLKNK